ncbi:hypothetical protein AVEN_52032-1 [Araneus ventricosus]|uniref:Uncharacterized protein n=1 Tax=Araneus ventricosus TaxID=182803 RepID=A0A4Y2CFY0_ARAVE|nr:hypothetical protein AVEN_52032-1 [Araneus ventricosus]
MLIKNSLHLPFLNCATTCCSLFLSRKEETNKTKENSPKGRISPIRGAPCPGPGREDVLPMTSIELFPDAVVIVTHQFASPPPPIHRASST